MNSSWQGERKRADTSMSYCWEQQVMSSCLWCVTWTVRPCDPPNSCLHTQVSSSGFLSVVDTGRGSFLQEGSSPWKSWSTFLLGSMLWRLHKSVNREAASFGSADNSYGLGYPGQEWANGLEKKSEVKLYKFFLVTSKSAKKKCYERKAQESRRIWGRLQAV